MRTIYISIILLVAVSSAIAECSRLEAYAAESVTDYLDSWKNVYQFYMQYKHCYDGAIAEGAADSIELLWAEHWDTLPEMLRLVESDSGFKKFIWERVEEEIFPIDRYETVQQYAKNKCPKDAYEFCSLFTKRFTK